MAPDDDLRIALSAQPQGRRRLPEHKGPGEVGERPDGRTPYRVFRVPGCHEVLQGAAVGVDALCDHLGLKG
jgi:hypothetical protein